MSAHTHIPINLAEELAVVIVALSEVVGSDQNVPATRLLRRDRVVEHVPQPRTVVLVSIVRLDVDAVPSEFLELATPVLQRR